MIAEVSVSPMIRFNGRFIGSTWGFAGGGCSGAGRLANVTTIMPATIAAANSINVDRVFMMWLLLAIHRVAGDRTLSTKVVANLRGHAIAWRHGCNADTARSCQIQSSSRLRTQTMHMANMPCE